MDFISDSADTQIRINSSRSILAKNLLLRAKIEITFSFLFDIDNLSSAKFNVGFGAPIGARGTSGSFVVRFVPIVAPCHGV